MQAIAVAVNLFVLVYHPQHYCCRCSPPNAQVGGREVKVGLRCHTVDIMYAVDVRVKKQKKASFRFNVIVDFLQKGEKYLFQFLL